MDKNIQKWVSKTLNNKISLKQASFGCVCCYCQKTFDFKNIIKWVDNDTTAICPYCQVDAVLPMNVEDHEEVLSISKQLQEYV